MGCQHTWQMGCPAGPCNDHPKPLLMSGFGKVGKTRRRSVCRDNFNLMVSVKNVKNSGGLFHYRPVRLTAHADGNSGRAEGACHDDVVSLCYGAVLIVILSCGAMWLSSNDIRQDTASDFGHFISQDQFAFFQPLQF